MIILLNHSAGTCRGDGLRERIADVLSSHGVSPEFLPSRSGAELSQMAVEAGQSSAEMVVAGGGDGTISTVAAALADTGKTLGILPLGTLNHFAKDLKIPLKLEEAVANLVEGRTVRVDVGEVNGRVFVNNSSIGLYPEIVLRREKERQAYNRGKWHAMLRAFIGALREYQYVHVHVRKEEEAFRRTTPFVFVGNNQYNLDSFGITGRETLTGGSLCFWLARRTRPLGILRLGIRAILGQLRGARDFEAHCGAEFQVTPHRKRVRVALDGETVVMKAPLHYRSRPGALQVRVPVQEPVAAA